MQENYQNTVHPVYNLLSEQDIMYFHANALQVLEQTGVKVDHAEGADLLVKNGCKMLESGSIAIPPELVEACIKSAPTEIRVYSQSGDEAMVLGGRRSYFGSGTDLVKTYDIFTGEYRLTTLQDVASTAKVADYCKNVDFVATFGLPSDVHKNLSYIENFRALLQNTSKPIFFTAAGKEDLEFIIQMAAAVAGGESALQQKPFLIHYSEPTAPLCHSYGAVQKVFLCADKQIPICYVPGDLMGASCPITLAGGITQALAEALSGIVLHQLRHPGAPIISGFAVVPMDMHTSIFSYGSPGWRKTNSAFADIFHHYNIPMWSTVGTDSFCLDTQAGFEHGIATLLAALDGANLIHDIGYLGQGLLANAGAIVMSDEIISYVRDLLQGFQCNSSKVGIDVIHSVGASGTFLKERHTLHNFREELWRPIHSNREDYETWIRQGKPTYAEKVIHKAQAIVKSHEPLPLSGEIEAQLGQIMDRAAKQLLDHKFKA